MRKSLFSLLKFKISDQCSKNAIKNEPAFWNHVNQKRVTMVPHEKNNNDDARIHYLYKIRTFFY